MRRHTGYKASTSIFQDVPQGTVIEFCPIRALRWRREEAPGRGLQSVSWHQRQAARRSVNAYEGGIIFWGTTQGSG